VTPVVEGYSAAYRRTVFAAAGGFDPGLAAADDVELSYRLAERGRLVFAPNAVVLHRHGPTLSHYVERSLRDGLWRSLVYARHPARLLGDPAVPLAQRSQVPLAGVAVVSAMIGARTPAALRVTGLALAAFLATTVPAAWRARRAGADVALASPGLALAGSSAQSVGLLIGGVAVVAQQVKRLVADLGRNRGG
jgi:hypothetical protein